MNAATLAIWSVAILLRATTLGLSIRNEKRLKLAGAIEYGKGNSLVLATFHGLLYLGAVGEAFVRQTCLDGVALAGVVVYAASMVFLALAIHALGGLWTVKLILADGHTLNRGRLFRTVRHPNYFLNIIPELVGIVLLCHAWITAAVILPPYAVSLAIRIRQEEQVMRGRFAEYR
jgi:isoprenylcysteine carboxyl methyltransferase (ICMT) family protein YpbQ